MEGCNNAVALIVDTDNEIFIARDAAGMAQHLLSLLDGEPGDKPLARRVAAVLGRDVLGRHHHQD